MKKPLLGIFAVFCLQLGFIAYNAIIPAEGSPMNVDEVATTAAPLPVFSDLDFVSSVPVSAPELTSDPEAPRAQRSGVPRPRSASVKNNDFRVFQTDFKSVSITVPKPSPFTFAVREPSTRTEYPTTAAPERTPAAYEVRTLERRKKRNFFAKSLAVVKKPYDWLKAVGSKLR